MATVQVSNSTKEHADEQRNPCRPMNYENLPKDDLMAQLYLKFFLITQRKVPSVNTCGVTKKVV